MFKNKRLLLRKGSLMMSLKTKRWTPRWLLSDVQHSAQSDPAFVLEEDCSNQWGVTVTTVSQINDSITEVTSPLTPPFVIKQRWRTSYHTANDITSHDRCCLFWLASLFTQTHWTLTSEVFRCDILTSRSVIVQWERLTDCSRFYMASDTFRGVVLLLPVCFQPVKQWKHK